MSNNTKEHHTLETVKIKAEVGLMTQQAFESLARARQLDAESREIFARTDKLRKEEKWYSLVVLSGIITAVSLASAAFTKLFL